MDVIYRSIETFYSHPEDKVFRYLKEKHGSHDLVFKRQESLRNIKSLFSEEQVKTVLWSLTFANLMSLRQVNQKQTSTTLGAIFSRNSDEIEHVIGSGSKTSVIGGAIADSVLTIGFGGGVLWLLEISLLGPGALIPLTVWAGWNLLASDLAFLPNFVSRKQILKNKMIATVNAGLIGEYIRKGDISLLASPESAQLDGKYDTARLQSNRVLDLEEFEKELRTSDDTELQEVLTMAQGDLNSELIAAGSPFYLTDEDYQGVVGLLKKAIENESRNRRPPRGLRKPSELNYAYIMLTQRAEDLRNGVSESNEVVKKLSQVIDLIDEILEDSDLKTSVLEQLISTRSEKQSALSTYSDMANELDRVAQQVRGKVFSGAHNVVNNALVQINGDTATVKGIVPAGTTGAIAGNSYALEDLILMDHMVAKLNCLYLLQTAEH